MNARRFPVGATIVVALAIAAMIGLGVWQLHRATWKDGLIARYTAAETMPPVAWPTTPPADDRLLFRHASGRCLSVAHWTTAAGRNRAGESGWRHVAWCRTGAEGPGMAVDMGWSQRWDTPTAWRGGPVSGVVSEAPDDGTLIATWFGPAHAPTPMLIATTAAPGLEPTAPPDPNDLPQNHRAYAVQWFAFAAAAAVIYALALRPRLRAPDPVAPPRPRR